MQEISELHGGYTPRIYIAYLCTSELVMCISRVDAKLKRQLSTRQRELLTDVREDLLKEFRQRQLVLW